MSHRTRITQSFTFHAAHQLVWHPGKCSNLHGHSYRFEVTLAGGLDANGVIVDFDLVDGIVEQFVLAQLDHTNLNDRFPNPTAELVCEWILTRLSDQLDGVEEVRLWETADSSAIVSVG